MSMYSMVSKFFIIEGCGTWVTLPSATPQASLAVLSVVSASEPSDIPWKPPMSARMFERPFTFLAIFNATSTEFVPVGPGNRTL